MGAGRSARVMYAAMASCSSSLALSRGHPLYFHAPRAGILYLVSHTQCDFYIGDRICCSQLSRTLFLMLFPITSSSRTRVPSSESLKFIRRANCRVWFPCLHSILMSENGFSLKVSE